MQNGRVALNIRALREERARPAVSFIHVESISLRFVVDGTATSRGKDRTNECRNCFLNANTTLRSKNARSQSATTRSTNRYKTHRELLTTLRQVKVAHEKAVSLDSGKRECSVACSSVCRCEATQFSLDTRNLPPIRIRKRVLNSSSRGFG